MVRGWFALGYFGWSPWEGPNIQARLPTGTSSHVQSVPHQTAWTCAACFMLCLSCFQKLSMENHTPSDSVAWSTLTVRSTQCGWANRPIITTMIQRVTQWCTLCSIGRDSTERLVRFIRWYLCACLYDLSYCRLPVKARFTSEEQNIDPANQRILLQVQTNSLQSSRAGMVSSVWSRCLNLLQHRIMCGDVHLSLWQRLCQL